MDRYSLKNIKKALLEGKVRLSPHTLEKILERGYSKRDILSCIWSTNEIENQNISGQLRLKISGFDSNEQMMVVIIARDQRKIDGLCVITAFPPTSKKANKSTSSKLISSFC